MTDDINLSESNVDYFLISTFENQLLFMVVNEDQLSAEMNN